MNNKVPIRSWEITLGSNQLILAVSTWLLLFSNWPFWRAVWQGVGGLQDGNTIFVLSLPALVRVDLAIRIAQRDGLGTLDKTCVSYRAAGCGSNELLYE